MRMGLASALAGGAFAATAILACSLRDTSYLQSGGEPAPLPDGGGSDVVAAEDTGPSGGPTRTATVIASGQVAPQYLTQDDANIYWSSGADILALKKDGSEPMPRVVAAAPGITFLVAEEGSGPNLFFTAGSEVKTVPKSGGTPSTIATTNPPPRMLAVDPTYVFAGADDEDLLEQGAVLRYTHNGGPATTLRPPDELSTIVALAAQGSDVYWDEGENEFFSLPKNSGPDAGPTRYSITGDDFDSAYTPLAFAVDDRALYYSNGTDVRAFAKAPTGAPTALLAFAPEAEVTAIAIDDTFVYAIDSRTDGTMQRNGKDGRGTPELMLGGLAKPTSIAVDATSVYLTLQGPPGAIVKCAK